jgi:hypothetical protein
MRTVTAEEKAEYDAEQTELAKLVRQTTGREL